MAQDEAAGAARKGSDLERPIDGEDPNTESADEARRWEAIYALLVHLEQQLLDVLAAMAPKMPDAARKEAEETNLPLLNGQMLRFRHRLDYWRKRRAALDSQGDSKSA